MLFKNNMNSEITEYILYTTYLVHIRIIFKEYFLHFSVNIFIIMNVLT